MLTLTILKEDELHEWAQFHSHYKSDFVKERDPLQLINAARANNLYVIRDENGAIRNTCGCFDYNGVDKSRFKEVGAVRVVDVGWGLQVLLMTAAVFSEWIFDPPNDPMLAVTSVKNIGSIKNINRSGFTQVSWLSPDRMASMDLSALDADKCYFEHTISSAEPVGATFIRNVISQKAIVKADRSLPISVDIPAVDFL